MFVSLEKLLEVDGIPNGVELLNSTIAVTTVFITFQEVFVAVVHVYD